MLFIFLIVPIKVYLFSLEVRRETLVSTLNDTHFIIVYMKSFFIVALSKDFLSFLLWETASMLSVSSLLTIMIISFSFFPPYGHVIGGSFRVLTLIPCLFFGQSLKLLWGLDPWWSLIMLTIFGGLLASRIFFWIEVDLCIVSSSLVVLVTVIVLLMCL